MTGAQHRLPAEPSAWNRLSPAEKTVQVRQAVQYDNMTYSQAATALGAPSRLAVAGVVDRAKKTSQPIIPSHSSGRGAVKAKPKKKHAGFHKFVAIPGIPDDVLEAAFVPARTDVWEALSGSAPVSIEDHREHTCRWPVGLERPFLYCGAVALDGGSYCASHAAVAFRPVPPARRKEAR